MTRKRKLHLDDVEIDRSQSSSLTPVDFETDIIKFQPTYESKSVGNNPKIQFKHHKIRNFSSFHKYINEANKYKKEEWLQALQAINLASIDGYSADQMLFRAFVKTKLGETHAALDDFIKACRLIDSEESLSDADNTQKIRNIELNTCIEAFRLMLGEELHTMIDAWRSKKSILASLESISEIILDYDLTITNRHTGGKQKDDIKDETIKENIKPQSNIFIENQFKDGRRVSIASFTDSQNRTSKKNLAGEKLIQRQLNVMFEDKLAIANKIKIRARDPKRHSEPIDKNGHIKFLCPDIDPSSIVLFDDDIGNVIQAIRAGYHAVWVNSSDKNFWQPYTAAPENLPSISSTAASVPTLLFKLRVEKGLQKKLAATEESLPSSEAAPSDICTV